MGVTILVVSCSCSAGITAIRYLINNQTKNLECIPEKDLTEGYKGNDQFTTTELRDTQGADNNKKTFNAFLWFFGKAKGDPRPPAPQRGCTRVIAFWWTLKVMHMAQAPFQIYNRLLNNTPFCMNHL